MVHWLKPILQNLGFQVSDASTPIYEDRQPTMDIIKANHLTPKLKNISVPIHCVHGKYILPTIDLVKLKITIQQEDIGTKISTCQLPEHN